MVSPYGIFGMLAMCRKRSFTNESYRGTLRGQKDNKTNMKEVKMDKEIEPVKNKKKVLLCSVCGILPAFLHTKEGDNYCPRCARQLYLNSIRITPKNHET